ncbi:MAG: hypothetical protein DYG89_39415 [Caldilinea sp. CFX5]|nr:hypothetical protein [Caldilinea sp. CFX5]
MSTDNHQPTFQLSRLGLPITLGLLLLIGLLLTMRVTAVVAQAQVANVTAEINPTPTQNDDDATLTAQATTESHFPVPAEGAYLGAYIGDLPGDYEESLVAIRQFEELTGRRLAIIHRFWGMTIFTPTQQARFGQYADFDWLHLDRHFADGRLVMISWNPVNSTMTRTMTTTITYQSIIDGRLDYVLTAAAQDAADFGKPLFIRWSWEMDGDWYAHSGPNAFGITGTLSWTNVPTISGHYSDTTKADGPERFVAAWRHVHAIFQQAGADNVIWVWSPNWLSSPIPKPDQITTTWNLLSAYYPGDDQVDWIGTSLYYRGDKPDHQWLSFPDMYNHQIGLGSSIAKFAQQHEKPVMIAEIGAAEKADNPLAKANWISTTYGTDVRAFPEIKAMFWFSLIKTEDSGQVIDWRVNSSPASLENYRRVMADPYYLDQAVHRAFLPMIARANVAISK